MPTDEERQQLLAKLEEDEKKAQFFSWLDEWFESKQPKEDETPQRTKQETGSFFDTLFK